MAERRRFSGGRLVVATHNQGKLREFADLLAPVGVEAVSAGSLGLPEPEETGDSFAANAALKARAAALASNLPALADDSGLAVDALDGAPGIYSARWAGPGHDFAAAMALVLERLEGAPDRGAAFVAALCLAWPDGRAEAFEGRVRGRVAPAPRGGGGFGYDPLFIPEGEARTFGEMTPAEKRRHSHRARALAAMLAACFAPGGGAG
ncbi:MAG: RdgB/HAM1 family non-canonical purine NTP pyrophosphatase [Geminicoccaceae bacterium]|nr:RdgB/HAM1 family non-canonical purine NTP pyrophosphatase [Geminicoccaceae bacterium]